jgi:hypothetical protein
MEGIRAGESGHKSTYDKKDDSLESSWGPFQLNRRRGSGTEFERDTAAERKRLGLGDLRDPRTIPLQARWVANYIKQHKAKNPNWSPYPNWQGFHGMRNANPRWGDSGYKPTGDAPEEAKAVKPNDYSKILPGKGGALKDNMSRSEIDTWNDAHKQGAGPGQTAAPHGAEFHDIKGKIKDFHDPEFDKFIKDSRDQRAEQMAEKLASSRMDLLRGHSPNRPNTHLGHALEVYRHGLELHKRLQKVQHEKALKERQGEANTGGTGDYGFVPWPGQNIPDKGIMPGHIGKYRGGEQDPAWTPRGYGIPDHAKKPNWGEHPMQKADLLGNARKAGMMGNQAQKVTGEASMRIDLRGFPKGTKTKTEMSGMFSQIRVARGRAMPLANQDS